MSSFKHLMGTMGKRTACILAALVLGCFAAAQASPATPALVAEILTALDRGDAQDAANLANVALREEVSASERASLLLYRGLARELLGESDSALDDFTSAIQTNALPPDEKEQTFLQRGFLRDSLGRLNEAIDDYSSVIKLKGASSATALNNRANIYRRQNRLEDAERDYVAALSAGGGKQQYIYYGLGQIAEARRDGKAARDFYVKAAIADPNFAAAAERLTALGAPPAGVVLAPDEAIVLRAPPGADARASPRPLNVSSPRAMPKAQLRPALDQSGGASFRSGTNQIQLGAWRSEAEAQAAWERAKASAGTALDGFSPQILAADVPGKGRYYRLRVRLEAGKSGNSFCAGLTAKDIACLPVPG